MRNFYGMLVISLRDKVKHVNAKTSSVASMEGPSSVRIEWKRGTQSLG